VKIITKYACEICGEEYESSESAMACEEKGKADPESMPTWVIFQQDVDNPKAVYNRITFCIVAWRKFNKHFLTDIMYACRDTGVGDSVGEETCGGSHLVRQGKYFTPHMAVKNFTASHFQRMVKYLRYNGKPVRYWDGEKIVPYMGE
jgi:hypothetical protein